MCSRAWKPALPLLLIGFATLPSALAIAVEDVQGDVDWTFVAEASLLPPTAEDRDAADLLEAWLTEDRVRGGWDIGLRPVAARIHDPTDLHYDSYSVHFSFAEALWVVKMATALEDETPVVRAGLYHDEVATDRDGNALEALEARWVSQNGSLQAFLPRDVLMEHARLEPRPPWALQDIRAEANVVWTLTCCPGGVQAESRLSDRAPDASALRLPVSFGSTPSGSLTAWLPTALRASNGGAGTFVFPVTWTLHEDGPFALQVASAPSAWIVALPFATIEGQSGDEVTLPVVVTVPFAHAHGAADTAVVEAGDATMEVGLRYVDPPQPAGHHPTLWIGAVEDPRAAVVDNGNRWTPVLQTVEPEKGRWMMLRGTYSPVESETYTRLMSLDPPLEVGLHLEPGIATMEVSVRSEHAFDGTMQATLFIEGQGRTPLVQFPPTELDLPGLGTMVDVVLTAAIDGTTIIPFERDQQMWLELRADGEQVTYGAQPATPTFEAGAHLRLPLRDYQDAPLGGGVGLISLQPGLVDLAVQPGDTASVGFAVGNAGPDPVEVTVRAYGPTGWIRPEAGHTVAVKAGTVQDIEFDVSLPTAVTETATLAIIATTEFGEWALAHVVVHSGGNATAEPADGPATKGATGPGAPLVLAVLATALVVRRTGKR